MYTAGLPCNIFVSTKKIVCQNFLWWVFLGFIFIYTKEKLVIQKQSHNIYTGTQGNLSRGFCFAYFHDSDTESLNPTQNRDIERILKYLPFFYLTCVLWKSKIYTNIKAFCEKFRQHFDLSVVLSFKAHSRKRPLMHAAYSVEDVKGCDVASAVCTSCYVALWCDVAHIFR